MADSPAHIAQLYYHAQADMLTPAEQEEWEAFARAHPKQVAYLDSLWDEPSSQTMFALCAPDAKEALRLEILNAALARLPFTETIKAAHRVHFLKTAWFRVAVILIILLTTIAIYYLANQNSRSLTKENSAVVQNILPGSNKAILTLSDGKKIELNNMVDTIYEGNLSIKNNNGQLLYVIPGLSEAKNPGSLPAYVAYNIMSTPNGGQYQLTLSDGTRVWLNAASSITYPTIFTGNTREVIITGEAYFEVKPGRDKPFIVSTSKEKITVLGTSFNVNAYFDEGTMKTSLLEGSVRVGDRVLKAGQAYLNGNIISTNIEQDVAWKNGFFTFNGAALPAVLRQLARWYDLDIKYEGKGTDQKLIGKLSRDLPLSEVIKVLEDFKVNCRMEGKTLIVK